MSSAVAERQVKPQSYAPSSSGLLQRKCACGNRTTAGEPCEACHRREDSSQRFGIEPRALGAAQEAIKRDIMTLRSGHDFGEVAVHSRAEQSERAAQRPPARLFDKETRELEVGHTDCDWDRAVKADEPFKPKSGKVKVKISGDVCTQPCTIEHEAAHVVQVEPICKTYFDCYTNAAAKAKDEKDCKDSPAGAERTKCEELYTEFYRLQCFVAVGDAWDAEKWECEAYKKSLACAEKERPKAGKECKDKLKEYEESAKKQIAKYCKPEKKTEEKPKGSPDKPAEPEAPKKDTKKKPDEPKK